MPTTCASDAIFLTRTQSEPALNMVWLLQFVIAGVILLVITALGFWRTKAILHQREPCGCQRRNNTRRGDSSGCQQIIRAEVLDTDVTQKGPTRRRLKNGLDPRESRAIPNKRLVHAFGINNCFTTAEKQRCAAFKALATKLVILDEEEWIWLADEVDGVCKRHLCSQTMQNLSGLIQLVTMKSVLGPLCGFDSSRTDVDAELQVLASEINLQWLRSKEGLTEENKFVNQTRLRQALAVIAPAWDGRDETENPLNLILPGYETLWRVVLRGFLEVVYRAKEPDRANWGRALQDFVVDPSLDQLDTVIPQYGGVSVHMIVKEALRLYPPTRRIYRAYQVGKAEPFEASADIEALHRDVATWGSDALKFDPTRWLGQCDHACFRKDNFMPFGNQPFVCVARGRGVKEGEKCLPFGVSMIAVILGGLVAAAGDDTKLVCAGSEWKTDEPLKTGREDYCEIELMQARRREVA